MATKGKSISAIIGLDHTTESDAQNAVETGRSAIFVDSTTKKAKIVDEAGLVGELGGGLATSTLDNTDDASTVARGNHYLCDTSTAAFGVTLPAGDTGAVLRFSDLAENFGTNALTLTPASGETIDGLAADETLILDVSSAWVQLMWDGSKWVLDAPLLSSVSSGVFPDGIATDSIKVNTASGSMSFQNQAGTEVGSYDDDGDWSLANSSNTLTKVTVNGSAIQGINFFKLGGTSYAGSIGNQRSSGRLILGANLTSQSTASDSYVATTTNGTSITSAALALGITTTSPAFDFRATDGVASATPDSLANYTQSLGSVSQTGAWTLGPSGYTGTHTVNGFLDVSTTDGLACSITNNFNSLRADGLRIQLANANSSAGTIGSTCFLRFFNTTAGTTENSDERFIVRTDGSAYNVPNNYGAISDGRLKENIEDARNYLSDLCKLRPVTFNFKSDPDKTKMLGLIAQEVEQIFPTLVDGGDNDTKGVKYSVINMIMLKAIQEQQAIIEELRSRLEALENG